MMKRRPTIEQQLEAYGVDYRDVPPVFRERTLAELKRQEAEEQERMRLDREQGELRVLATIKRSNPNLGGMLEDLMRYG